MSMKINFQQTNYNRPKATSSDIEKTLNKRDKELKRKELDMSSVDLPFKYL